MISAHRFHLHQIEPAIQKRASGKFSWLGKTRPTSNERLKDEPVHHSAAVTGDLDDVLASIAPWSAEHGRGDVVRNRPISAEELPVVNRMRGYLAERPLSTEAGINNRNRLGPRNTHDCQPADSGGVEAAQIVSFESVDIRPSEERFLQDGKDARPALLA